MVATHKGDGTHVEDVKDSVEVQFPGGDRFFIARRMDESRDRVPLALFDDLPLDLCHSPAIKSVVSELPKVSRHHRFDPRHQLLNRLAHGLTEII